MERLEPAVVGVAALLAGTGDDLHHHVFLREFGGSAKCAILEEGFGKKSSGLRDGGQRSIEVELRADCFVCCVRRGN